MHEAQTIEDVCPRCGEPTSRESVDVGVGVIEGPEGCTGTCGWSESTDYDALYDGGLQDDGSYLDPHGNLYPAASFVARAIRGDL